jgi:hypothetical protein
MSLEKLIILSSNDKDSNVSNNNSDFVVNLRETYYTQDIKRILVKEVQVPNNFYNIRDGTNGSQNNELKITEQGFGQVTATVPQGQYTITEYLTALDLAVNAVMVATVFTSTLDVATKKITMTGVGNTTILDATSNMASALGLQTTTANQLVHIMDALPNLSGINMVYVHSKDVAENHGIDGDSGLISVMESLSFHDVPFGAMGYKQNNDDELALIDYDQPKNLKTVLIVLRDDLGNKLDIGTSEMTVVLKCFF